MCELHQGLDLLNGRHGGLAVCDAVARRRHRLPDRLSPASVLQDKEIWQWIGALGDQGAQVGAEIVLYERAEPMG